MIITFIFYQQGIGRMFSKGEVSLGMKSIISFKYVIICLHLQVFHVLFVAHLVRPFKYIILHILHLPCLQYHTLYHSDQFLQFIS